MAAAADSTSGLISEALYQDNAASNALAASFGPSGSILNGGVAGPDSADLSTTGIPGSLLPLAIELDGLGDYAEFTLPDSTGTECTIAAIVELTGQLASLDGIIACFNGGAAAFGIICPGNVSDQIGYQMGGNGSHLTETWLKMPRHRFGLVAVACNATQAVITIMDLAGRVQQRQVIDTHPSINFAGKLTVGWRGVTPGQHLAPMKICAHGLWARELALLDLIDWKDRLLGAEFVAAQSTDPAVPIASGDPGDAAKILSGELGRIGAWGDSNMGDWVQAADRLLVGQNQAVRGICSRNVSGWQTPFATPSGVSANAHDGTLNGTAQTLKITRMDFSGDVAPSGGFATRSINQVALGTDSRYATRDSMRDAWGYCPILRAKQMRRDLTLRVPIYRHHDGCTNAAVQIVLESDGVEIAAGNGFAGYAATAGWVYESVTVPWADLPDDFTKITARLCLVDGVTTQSGKSLYSAGLCVELYDPLITRGTLLHVFAEGGTTAANFASESYLTAAQMVLAALPGMDVQLIDFGVNLDAGATTAEDQRDGMLDLIARMRQFSPSSLIALKSAFATSHTEGGEFGATPIYATANYLAQQLTKRCLHINVPRMLVDYGIARGTAKDNWDDHAPEHLFPALALVPHGGVYYYAKATHVKEDGSGGPSADSTNWGSTGLAVATLASDVGYASKLGSRHEYENAVHYDDAYHAHPYGHRLAAAMFVAGLKVLAGVPENEILAKIDDLIASNEAVVESNQLAVEADFVPAWRTWKLGRTRDAVGPPIPLTTGETQLLAMDFADHLPTNGTVKAIREITLTALDADGDADGITFSETRQGVDRTLAKVEATPVTGGTYLVELAVTYSNGDQAEGRGRISVDL